jgi:hypothetical protein
MSLLPTFSSADDFWPAPKLRAETPHPFRLRTSNLLRRAVASPRAALGQLVLWRMRRRAARELLLPCACTGRELGGNQPSNAARGWSAADIDGR